MPAPRRAAVRLRLRHGIGRLTTEHRRGKTRPMPQKPAAKKAKRWPITVARIRRAYAATGLLPRRCSWFRPAQWRQNANAFRAWRGGDRTQQFDGEACALGAMAIAESITTKFTTYDAMTDRLGSPSVCEHLGLDVDFTSGFVLGFDGGRVGRHATAKTREGFQNGRAVAKALGLP